MILPDKCAFPGSPLGQDGLTKRELLAALSLSRIEIYGDYGDKEVARIAASQAVMTADAILAELERTS